MSPVQQYWLPGYGLSRHIVLGHIQYFLGPTATVRPYSYQVCLSVASTTLSIRILTRYDYRGAKVISSMACHSRGFVFPIFIYKEFEIGKREREPNINNTNSSKQEQIDDLAVMSRDYEKQEATRMAHNTSGASTSSPSSDNPAAQSEPYINEIIPINQPGTRRPADSRGGR